MPRLLTVSAAANRLGIAASTLRRREKEGRIKKAVRVNERGDRRFRVEDLDSLLRSGGAAGLRPGAVLYARVSGRGDRDSSVTNQKNELSAAVVDAGREALATFSDVGSGLNEKRPGLSKALLRAKDPDVTHFYVTHEDRLARFGVAWLRMVLEASGAELVVLHTKGSSKEEELVTDFVSLVSSFSGRLYGQRSAATRKRLLARVDPDGAGSPHASTDQAEGHR